MMTTITILATGAVGATATIPLWLIIPFITLLLLIAVMPLTPPKVKHFWEHNYPFIAIGLGVAVVLYYFLKLEGGGAIVGHTMHEYVSFIALIGSLFVTAGGIHIKIRREARPLGNVLFLAIAAVLANLIGTTGASMVLIRPFIRMNKYRVTAFHIIFFIFIVSNVGGALTPIGDPPLYLGYLRGVPFFWLLGTAVLPWLFTLGLLLLVFYILDSINFRRAAVPIRKKETGKPLEAFFQGWLNVILLLVIIGAVLVSTELPHWYEAYFVREGVMLVVALISYKRTRPDIHNANDFSFGPIKEVAYLFAGIFATMMPALGYLEEHGKEFGIDQPRPFYFATGGLSAVLDNAPTYVNFLKLAEVAAVSDDERFNADGSPKTEKEIVRFLVTKRPDFILAISLGAVFFGAMTYIGNGPNFMVKSIAESSKVRVPSFMGYIFKYSLPILLPILILAGLLFL
ncbi:MAG: sodium:proton antiporter [Verrucomicrobiota bacterium]|nr:sodium:proton antiporter [Verrucomicrobiota bacterium]